MYHVGPAHLNFLVMRAAPLIGARDTTFAALSDDAKRFDRKVFCDRSHARTIPAIVLLAALQSTLDKRALDKHATSLRAVSRIYCIQYIQTR